MKRMPSPWQPCFRPTLEKSRVEAAVASLQRLRDIPGPYRTLMAHLRGATVSGDSAASCGP
jgi:hypothetical protein